MKDPISTTGNYPQPSHNTMGSFSAGKFVYFLAFVLMVCPGSNRFAASRQKPTTDVRHLLRIFPHRTPKDGHSSVTNTSGVSDEKSTVSIENRRLSGNKHEKTVDSRFSRSSKDPPLSNRRTRPVHKAAASDAADSILHYASGNLLVMAAVVAVEELEKTVSWAQQSEQVAGLPDALGSSHSGVTWTPGGGSGRVDAAPTRDGRSALEQGVGRSKLGGPPRTDATLPQTRAECGEPGAGGSGPTLGDGGATWSQNPTASLKRLLKGRLETSKPLSRPRDARWMMGKANSARCLADLLASRASLLTSQRWAQLMADSSGHLVAGMMDKEIDFVGIVGECLAVQVPPLLGFRTKYCVVTFTFTQVRLFPLLSCEMVVKRIPERNEAGFVCINV